MTKMIVQIAGDFDPDQLAEITQAVNAVSEKRPDVEYELLVIDEGQATYDQVLERFQHATGKASNMVRIMPGPSRTQ